MNRTSLGVSTLNDMIKNVVLWVVIAVVLMSLFNNFGPQSDKSDTALSYSQFIDSVKAGQVQQVVIDEHIIKGKLQGGQVFKTMHQTIII